MPMRKRPSIPAEVFTTLMRWPTGVIVQNDESGEIFAIANPTPEQADDPALVAVLDHYTAATYLAEAGGKPAAAARQATSDLLAEGALL